MVFRTTCGKCSGVGNIVKDPCKTCSGSGALNMTQHEEIVIPAGIDNGQSLKTPGKGGVAPRGGVPGDLLIRVNEKQDEFFRRDGPNIHTEVYLTISQAVLGGKITVKTIDGYKTITIKQGIQQGEKMRLTGMGLPDLASGGNRRGDHFIEFKVVIPTEVTVSQAELFKASSSIEPHTNQGECVKKNAEKRRAEQTSQYQGHIINRDSIKKIMIFIWTRMQIHLKNFLEVLNRDQITVNHFKG